jgi:ectoine hydroxylase-related dioxygenase (phytanoyl-CoA dioxygenase family)
MNPYKNVLSEAQVAEFNTNGYLILPAFFNQTETQKLYAFATEDEAIGKHSYGMKDSTGRESKLALWFNPGNDPFGLMARSERMVGIVNQLLDGTSDVAHYHSKLMQKEPKVGGAWEWHQDYGYWYRAQFPFPDQLISVMTALSPANRENGCLQVIKGSHKMGRVEHGHDGNQMGADMNYVNQALTILEHVYVELNPGDVLIFHSNIFHRSEANLSDKPRWSFISAYNRVSNVPLLEKSTACITPIVTVDDERLQDEDIAFIADGTDFLSIETDVNIK